MLIAFITTRLNVPGRRCTEICSQPVSRDSLGYLLNLLSLHRCIDRVQPHRTKHRKMNFFYKFCWFVLASS